MKKSNPNDAAERRFWQLAAELIDDPDYPHVAEGTLMGFRCLQVNGAFMAVVTRQSRQLVVKLDKKRVAELIESGEGLPFAPAKKVFKEWVEIVGDGDTQWRDLMREAARWGATR